MTFFSGLFGNPPVPVTCGLIVRSPQGWLLGRATSLGHWDLPKGKAESGEAHAEAAMRECLEETGLDFSAWRHQLQDLGTRPYHKKRGKRLHLFSLDLPEAPSLEECKCSTYVTTRGEKPMPEMDAWAWVNPSVVPLLVNRRMSKHLRKRALVVDPLLVSVTLASTVGLSSPHSFDEYARPTHALRAVGKP